jgi:hypothetical protein
MMLGIGVEQPSIIRWYWVRCFRASPLKKATLLLLKAMVDLDSLIPED